MITNETIANEDHLAQAAAALNEADIAQLVDRLSLKENDVRYQALLLLKERSRQNDDVYPYWDVFHKKLRDKNSFQRSIGALLLAENVRWDTGRKTEAAIDSYLTLLYDEKPITIRQSIQALIEILPYRPELHEKIANALMAVNLMKIKETMRKLVLADIIEILLLIRDKERNEAIESYLLKLLTGEILDKKTRKQLEKVFM